MRISVARLGLVAILVAACSSSGSPADPTETPAPAASAQSTAPEVTPEATPEPTPEVTPEPEPSFALCDPEFELELGEGCMLNPDACPEELAPERIKWGDACVLLPAPPPGFTVTDYSRDGFGGEFALWSDPDVRSRGITWKTGMTQWCASGGRASILVADMRDFDVEAALAAMDPNVKGIDPSKPLDRGDYEAGQWSGRYETLACPTKGVTITRVSARSTERRFRILEAWLQTRDAGELESLRSLLAAIQFKGGYVGM